MNQEELIKSLAKRPGLSDKKEILSEFVHDSITEIQTYLNYGNEELPDGCIPAVKQFVMVRFNQDGAEGIQSESQSSGGSTTYSDELPDSIKRAIRKYRRLPGVG